MSDRQPAFAYDPLVTRLRYYSGSDASDLQTFEALPFIEKVFERRQPVFLRESVVQHIMLVTSGWAARTRYTKSGGRQIINILLPGDILTPDVFVLERADHEVEALSTLTVRFIEQKDLLQILQTAPKLFAALWWAGAQEDSFVREHVVRLGRRTATERVGHLILELHRRLEIVKQATPESMIMPITQAEIADTVGLTNVHVSKTLAKLEDKHFIRRQKTVVELLDRNGLAEFCDFDLVHFHMREFPLNFSG